MWRQSLECAKNFFLEDRTSFQICRELLLQSNSFNENAEELTARKKCCGSKVQKLVTIRRNSQTPLSGNRVVVKEVCQDGKVNLANNVDLKQHKEDVRW